MVRWHHLIITAYGFWLPNDPRGSWSDFVGAWELLRFGGATKVSNKRSYAHDPHDRARRLNAKKSLKYPVVRFNSMQRDAVARGFARAVTEADYVIHACCIGFDHAHLVVQRHSRPIERIAGHLKSKAAMEVRAAGTHPLHAFEADGVLPSMWAERSWSVFISEREHLRCAVDYVDRHPGKEGLPEQNWDFVTKI